MKTAVTAVAAAAALVAAGSGSGKDFQPGDLRLCNATRCVDVVHPRGVALLGPFYYSGAPPAEARRPRLGSPYYELRFRNGYATGIVATQSLDRFLSYGVHLERFRRGAWYRVPAALAAEFRRLAAGVRPLRLTRAAVAKSR